MKRVAGDDGPSAVRYGEELIHYTVRHQPGRKSGRIAIHVEPNGRVLVCGLLAAGCGDRYIAVV